MAIGGGLATQIGIVKESVVNTAVAVTAFNPLISSSLMQRIQTAQDMGLQAGQMVPFAARRIITGLDGGGDVQFNIASKAFGRWAQMGMGSTPTAAQISTSGAYTQFHSLGSADGVTFTIQHGIPSTDGTVNPFTFSGCKCTAWELAAAPGGLMTWKATIDFMTAAPTGSGALGLQTASYSADQNFGFNNVTVGTFSAMTIVSSLWTPTSPTSPGVVRNISLKGGQAKKVDRWQAGSQVKAEALGNAFIQPTGQLDIDYASNALYTKYAAGTSLGLQISATGAIIGTSGTNVATVQFTMPACVLEQGSAPVSNGPDVVTVSYPFSVLDDGTNGAMQCYIISTDAAV